MAVNYGISHSAMQNGLQNDGNEKGDETMDHLLLSIHL